MTLFKSLPVAFTSSMVAVADVRLWQHDIIRKLDEQNVLITKHIIIALNEYEQYILHENIHSSTKPIE